MPSPVADLVPRFRFNESLLDAATAGFEPRAWAEPPSARGGNPPHWILGHLARSRRGLLRKLGADVPAAPWEEVFDAGAAPGDAASWPPVDELRADLRASGEALAARLAELDEGAAAAPWGTTFPDGGTTLADGVRFLYFHEVYHLGQLGYARRLHGLPGFA